MYLVAEYVVSFFWCLLLKMASVQLSLSLRLSLLNYALHAVPLILSSLTHALLISSLLRMCSSKTTFMSTTSLVSHPNWKMVLFLEGLHLSTRVRLLMLTVGGPYCLSQLWYRVASTSLTLNRRSSGPPPSSSSTRLSSSDPNRLTM